MYQDAYLSTPRSRNSITNTSTVTVISILVTAFSINTTLLSNDVGYFSFIYFLYKWNKMLYTIS